MSDGDRIAGLVLAAGASSRHADAFKLLLPFDGGTVVGAAVRAPVAAGLRPVVVVVGHRAAEVRAAVGEQEVEFVENRRYRHGLASSLSSVIRRLEASPDVTAAAILLGDEPGMAPAVIREVAAAWRQADAAVVRALYRDRPGHPVVVQRTLFPLLRAVEGDQGLSALFEARAVDVHPVPVQGESPVDIDTPDDYRRALGRRGKGASPAGD